MHDAERKRTIKPFEQTCNLWILLSSLDRTLVGSFQLWCGEHYLETAEIIVWDIFAGRTCVSSWQLLTCLPRPVINTRPVLRHDASATELKIKGWERGGRRKDSQTK